ncbi:hypothetical protein [Caballeronia sp. SL2Y3]|uniref:hypothetical protein n=1 Tax=Caballeronia sp. SL2Y3 TaxID=2878151 RepID=UPI001FD1176A|nr:hypothetical protein [Caballeronia sp. SL2Y3]
MFSAADHYCFGTSRSAADVTRDEIAAIASAMQAARQAFLLGFDGMRMAHSREHLRSVLGRSSESFPEWVWQDQRQMAEAVREEVEKGRLVFVPEPEDLRRCARAIQADRQKQCSLAVQQHDSNPYATVQQMMSKPPRLPQNLDIASSFGDAEPFEYQPDDPGGAVDTLAGGEGTPSNNQAQNKQFRAVVRALGLDKDQAQELHMEVSKQGLGYHEIMERAQDLFGGAGD